VGGSNSKHTDFYESFKLLVMNALKKLLPLALFCLSVFVACNKDDTITQVATNPSDVITGTFGTTFTDQNGISHTLSGSYRVIRDW
jgi:hypothetical protein